MKQLRQQKQIERTLEQHRLRDILSKQRSSPLPVPLRKEHGIKVEDYKETNKLSAVKDRVFHLVRQFANPIETNRILDYLAVKGQIDEFEDLFVLFMKFIQGRKNVSLENFIQVYNALKSRDDIQFDGSGLSRASKRKASKRELAQGSIMAGNTHPLVHQWAQ